MKKRVYYFLATALIALGLLSVGYYTIKNNSQKKYGEELIAKASAPLKSDLNSFLFTVEKSITSFNHQIKSTDFDAFNPKTIDTLTNTVLNNDNYLKGVVIFAQHFKYVFLKDNDTRITTFTSKGDSLLSWKRLDKNLKPISEWTDTYNFFLNKQNRKILENTPSDDKMVKWIKINSEIPGRKELILQIHQLKTNDDKDIYVAYVFVTKDFSDFFMKKLSMKNPMVTILAKTGEVFTPLVTDDTAILKRIEKEEVEVKKIFNTWQKAMDNQPHSFSFELNNRVFWSHIETINNELGIKAFSLTISAEDLNHFYSHITEIYLYIGGALILFGIAILLLLWLLNRKSKKEDGELPEKYSSHQIMTLINQGESEYVEYKSSLRYDYRQEKENKLLENVIVKSIAAFSNAKGGTLIIGVDDNQHILGLENDFSTLKKKDIDYFELHLRKLISNQFGINFSNHRLIIQFPVIEDKVICVIQITRAKKPIYVKVKSKQGQIVEKFYVRSGNSSQEITSLKEMEEYIRNRFAKR